MVGFRPASAKASAAVLPPPTLGRSTSVARTCTSWLTLKLRSSLRRPTPLPRNLASTWLSLDPDLLVSLQTNNHTHPLVYGVLGERWKVTARKEIIVSAGVFNTPQLLLLSGIGDPEELESLGITPRVDLPSVGKNMTDHVFLISAWETKANETFETYTTPDVLAENIEEWNQTRQGPLSWTLANQMAWVRLPEDDPIIQNYGDATVGPTCGHYQIIWVNGWAVVNATKPEGSWMSVATNLIASTARKCLFPFAPLSNLSLSFWGRVGGSLTLRSSDPFESPNVDPNYLGTDSDVQTIVAGLKTAIRFFTADAWKGFIGNPWSELAAANTDEELAEYARNHASTYVEILYHFTSWIS